MHVDTALRAQALQGRFHGLSGNVQFLTERFDGGKVITALIVTELNPHKKVVVNQIRILLFTPQVMFASAKK